MNITKKIIYPAIILWGLMLAILFHVVQPPNNYSVNEKADANEYLKIYAFFESGSDWENIRFGIHNRLFVPFLAALMPVDGAVINFFLLNTIFALLSLLALYYLLDFLQIKQTCNFVVLVFFSLHYVGPFR